MTRVKGGTTTKRRHKKILDKAKGYWMSRSKQYKKAKEAVLHAGEYAYAGRKLRKRQMRRLWITRLNATLKAEGLKYSTFIHALKGKKIELDRKILSTIATEHPSVFAKIIEKIK